MRVKSPPNDLRCGCRLGPTIQLCDRAQEIYRRKQRYLRLTIGDPFDFRAERRYNAACDELDRHWAAHGLNEIGPAHAHASDEEEATP